jgi:hypothetical protein
MLEEFMEVFSRQEHKSFLFKSLFRQIVDHMELTESVGRVAPFLQCKNMIVCLNSEFRKQASRKKSTLKQSVELRYFEDSKESIINKILKQILLILKIYGERDQSPEESIEEEVLVADVSALVQIRFLNNVLLFPRNPDPPETQNCVAIGNSKVLLFSNYVQFFSPNINCVILGILAVFFLTKKSLFWNLDDFAVNKKNSFFLSFPIQLIVKLNPREKDFIVQSFAQENTGIVGDLFDDYLQNAQRIWKKSDLESQSSYEMMTLNSETEQDSVVSSAPSINLATPLTNKPFPITKPPSTDFIGGNLSNAPHSSNTPSRRPSAHNLVQFPSADSQSGFKDDSDDESLGSKYLTLNHVTPHLFNRLCFGSLG